LVDVANGKIQYLIIEAPPRHGKSELVSKYFPTWYLGNYPERQVVLCAYGDDFAAGWGQKVRNLLEEYGPSNFGIEVDPRTNARDDWKTRVFGGGMLSKGVGGQILGRGADVLIIDDPIKGANEADSENSREKIWDWFNSGAKTRLTPTGAIIIIMQRWSIDDLVGRLKTQERDKWTVLTLPAIAEWDDCLGRPEGEPLWPEGGWTKDKLNNIKTSTSKKWWNAQYQQRPSTNENAEWSEHYFENVWIKEEDFPKQFEVSAMALDPSKGGKTTKGDYSAAVFVGVLNGTGYVASDLQRRPIERMVEDTLRLHARYRPDALSIETNAFQELLVPEFKRQNGGYQNLNIHEDISRVNKNLRISRLGPLLEGKEFKFLDTPSNRLLVNQLKEFPLASHDDGPDALEMACRMINKLREPKANDGLGNNIFGGRTPI
jgi:predicted phage terminase large subunit-like protein